VHAHWVIPGGVMGALARGGRPMVISLHGSDVFVAERNGLARRAARAAFHRAAWVTACSDDLRTRAIALGADRACIETVPYGVDTTRFTPSAAVRAAVRDELGIGSRPLVVSAGRLVSKKGFEFLIDAAAALARDRPDVAVVIAGSGDLADALTARAAPANVVRLVGNRSQDEIARLVAAADVVAVPSVQDDAGNVDGLPNFALEALASATPVVATRAGGLPQAITDGVTGRLVEPRDVPSLAAALASVLADPARAADMGAAARARIVSDFSWPRAVARFVDAYDRACPKLRGSVSVGVPR